VAALSQPALKKKSVIGLKIWENYIFSGDIDKIYNKFVNFINILKKLPEKIQVFLNFKFLNQMTFLKMVTV